MRYSMTRQNNKYAIEELDKLGITAYFFIVPQFINSVVDEQKKFFINNIRPSFNSYIDDSDEDFESFSWDYLKEITKKHTIGSHTNTHTMIKGNLNRNELNKEIIDSKLIIENKLGVKVRAFCSINNTLVSVGRREKQLIQQNYLFHFTTFGGNNRITNRYLIKRINIESHWLLGAVKFALSSLEFYRWQRKINYYIDSTK